jgi:hypothetical protein
MHGAAILPLNKQQRQGEKMTMQQVPQMAGLADGIKTPRKFRPERSRRRSFCNASFAL